MNIRAARQMCRIDFHARAQNDELPFGTGGRHCIEQLEIHPLVDRPEEPEPRVGDGGLIRWVGLAFSRGAEMRHVDAARKCVDMTMALALRLVQALAAGKYQVGAFE